MVILANLAAERAAAAVYPPLTFKNGVVDLRHHEPQSWRSPRMLQGEWAFAPSWRPSFAEVSAPTFAAPDLFYQIPEAGFPALRDRASYQLKILRKAHTSPLILTIDDLPFYKLYVNGRLLAVQGDWGRDGFSPEAPQRGRRLQILPDEEELNIILQVYHDGERWESWRHAFLIGPAPVMQHEFQKSLTTELLSLGGIAMIGLYHLALFILNRRQRGAFYLALLCGAHVIRMGQGATIDILYVYLPHFNYEWGHKIGFTGYYLCILGMMGFVFESFPGILSRKIFSFYKVMAALFVSAVLLFDVTVYAKWNYLYHFVTLSSIVVALYALFRVVQRKMPGHKAMMIGFLIIGASAINDMLYVQNLPSLGSTIQFGLFIFVLCQGFVLSEQFNIAYRNYEHLNTRLDLTVKERTKTISTIIDNVKNGFFTVSSSLLVQDGFTLSCNTLLGLGLSPGKHFFEVFHLSKRDEEAFEAAFEQIFEGLLPPDAAIANLPTRFGCDGKVFEVVGSAIADESGRVSSMLFSVNDITKLASVEEENLLNRKLLRILKYRESFKLFVVEAYQKALVAKELVDEAGQKMLRSMLHTLKGNAALFEMDDISSTIHRIEEEPSITAAQIDHIVQQFQTFMTTHLAPLGFCPQGEAHNTIEISKADVAYLKNAILKAHNPDLLFLFESWYRKAVAVDIKTLLGPAEQAVEQIAVRLGKRVRLKLQGEDARIDPAPIRELLQVLYHLLRNAVDHGIEYPEERGDKDPIGTIAMKFDCSASELTIFIHDDGRGIDRSRLVAAAISRGVFNAAQAEQMTAEQQLKLIFTGGLTTKSAAQISELSGRGTGMFAVISCVEALGGSIQVESSKEAGTTFMLRIPWYSDQRGQHAA
jgi:signal transduction histidine kinase